MKINKEKVDTYHPKIEIASYMDSLGKIELYAVTDLIWETMTFIVSNKHNSQNYMKTFPHISEAIDYFNELVKYF